MRTKFSIFLSYLFHPLLMPLYGYLIILYTNNYFSYFFSWKTKILLLSLVFGFTFLLPALNILLLRKLNVIKSITLHDGKDRTFPYLVTVVFYLGLCFLIWDFELSFFFKAVILAGGISILTTSIINKYWKISAHLIGIGGLTGAIIGASLILKQEFIVFICVALGIAGLLGFARIQLKAHTPWQIYSGFFLGTFITTITVVVAYLIQIIDKSV